VNGHSEESRRKELQENRHDKTITEEKGKKGNEPLKQVLTYFVQGEARCIHVCPNHHKTFPVGIP
jgi:ribosomal protein L21E